MPVLRAVQFEFDDVAGFVIEQRLADGCEVADDSFFRVKVPRAKNRESFGLVRFKVGRLNSDIVSWADLLNLDDYVSFGGKA